MAITCRVFHMSDGSSIDIPRQDSVFPQSIHGRSLKYMQTMLASLGIAPGQEVSCFPPCWKGRDTTGNGILCVMVYSQYLYHTLWGRATS